MMSAVEGIQLLPVLSVEIALGCVMECVAGILLNQYVSDQVKFRMPYKLDKTMSHGGRKYNSIEIPFL